DRLFEQCRRLLACRGYERHRIDRGGVCETLAQDGREGAQPAPTRHGEIRLTDPVVQSELDEASMKYKTRDEVKTPVGEGVVQGNFEVRQSGDTVEQCVLVRVPITDETRHLLGAASCLTP